MDLKEDYYIEMLKAENNFLKNKIEKVENDLNEEKRKKNGIDTEIRE